MDLSSLEKLKERMEEMAKLQLSVGVPSSKNADRGQGINQAGLAAIHEFGAPAAGIPERSFLRSTVKEQNGYSKEIASVSKRVMRGEAEPKEALEMVGMKAVGDIQQKIANGIGPALSEATIKRKKSSKPLIDTGQLRQSIDYEVK